MKISNVMFNHAVSDINNVLYKLNVPKLNHVGLHKNKKQQLFIDKLTWINTQKLLCKLSANTLQIGIHILQTKLDGRKC